MVLILFNRPAKTRAVFSRIRSARPERLFLIADGPRAGHPEDAQRCEEARAAVADIDWPCEVTRVFAAENMGLRRRIVSGLDEAFAATERAVVLEDDCLPHPDFFPFMDELLERYEADRRIGTISGDNFQRGRTRGEASYYFSAYPHCWGWGTWRQVWKEHDPSMAWWPAWRDSPTWKSVVPDAVERGYWEAIFDACYQGEIDSWAYPWTADAFRRGQLTALPNANLVENIGVGPDATHTRGRMTVPPAGALGFPLRHPRSVERNVAADRFTFEKHFGGTEPSRTRLGLVRLVRDAGRLRAGLVDRLRRGSV